MASAPVLSIIVPHLRGHFFEPALTTFADRLDKSIEMIIVENGLAATGKPNDSVFRNVLKLHLETADLGGARNLGLEQATGKYIWFLDADDMINERCVAGVTSLLRATSADLIFIKNQDFESPYSDKAEVDLSRSKPTVAKAYQTGGKMATRLISRLEYSPQISHWILNRNLARTSELRFSSQVFHEDHSYVFRALALASEVIYTDWELHLRGRRPDSLTQRISRKDSVEGYQLARGEIVRFVDSRNAKGGNTSPWMNFILNNIELNAAKTVGASDVNEKFRRLFTIFWLRIRLAFLFGQTCCIWLKGLLTPGESLALSATQESLDRRG